MHEEYWGVAPSRRRGSPAQSFHEFNVGSEEHIVSVLVAVVELNVEVLVGSNTRLKFEGEFCKPNEAGVRYRVTFRRSHQPTDRYRAYCFIIVVELYNALSPLGRRFLV
jgi:hypothetical protein